jgi:hypothetical protein
MHLFEQRASVILFNFLRSLPGQGAFLIPANVCPIVVATFLKARRDFEFIDISPTTFCLDQEQTLAKLQTNPQRYAGVLFVRTYGISHSFDAFFAAIKAAAPDVAVIDDRCLCPPSFDATNDVADLLLYSTGYSKYVDIDFGGFGWMPDKLLYQAGKLPYDRADLDRLTANFKEAIETRKPLIYEDSDWLDTTEPSISWQEYTAKVTRTLAAAAALKAELNHVYSTELPPAIQLPEDYHAWRFNIVVPEKRALLKRIFDEGLFGSSHYAAATGIFTSDPFPHAQKLHSNVVNLFNDFRFDADKARRVVQIILDHLQSRAPSQSFPTG